MRSLSSSSYTMGNEIWTLTERKKVLQKHTESYYDPIEGTYVTKLVKEELVDVVTQSKPFYF